MSDLLIPDGTTHLVLSRRLGDDTILTVKKLTATQAITVSGRRWNRRTGWEVGEGRPIGWRESVRPATDEDVNCYDNRVRLELARSKLRAAIDKCTDADKLDAVLKALG